MGREPHGHAGQAQDTAPPFLASSPEVVHGLLPDGPVVESRRHDRLGVHINAARQQAVDLAQDVALARIAHHLHPGRRVGGMDRHVDGAQPFAHDAVQLRLVTAGKRREVAVEEGETDILILQVEGLPETLGHLVHEAEHAVLLADLHLVLGQVHADTFAPVLHKSLEGAAIRPLHEQLSLVLPGDQILVVELIQHRLAMDLEQRVAGADPGLFGQAVRFHRDDPNALLSQGLLLP